jgi:hypothetical protein
MYKGYRSYLFYKDLTNKTINHLPHIITCDKCRKLISVVELQDRPNRNVQLCLYCGNPCYIIKPSK